MNKFTDERLVCKCFLLNPGLNQKPTGPARVTPSHGAASLTSLTGQARTGPKGWGRGLAGSPWPGSPPAGHS